MSKFRTPHSSRRSGQGGMTLLIGLILLLMLTAVSTIGFRNTSLSERMTGNSADRNVSFQSAESAGKEALTGIEAGTVAALAKGYYAVPLAKGGNSNYWTKGEGATVSVVANCPASDPFSWKSCSADVGTKYDNNTSNAQYVIELLKTDASSGLYTYFTYRITSRSTGGSGVAEVILQTNYIRCVPIGAGVCP